MEKVRVLVVDDVRTFPQLDNDETYDVAYARTTARAIQLLDAGGWDEVWWDHDMDFYDWNDTTIPAVKHMAELKPDVKRIVVHTANYYGRKNINDILIDAGYDYPDQRYPGFLFNSDSNGDGTYAAEAHTAVEYFGYEMEGRMYE